MPTYRMQSRQRIPYGGGIYLNFPERGIVGEGTNYDMVRTRVLEYRKANSIPIGLGFEDDLEQAICERYPAECECVDPNMPRVRELSMHQIVNGTTTLARISAQRATALIGLSASPFVSQEEANRRAQICQKCPFNTTFRKPCTGLCPEIRDVVMAVKGNRSTPYDQETKSCSICGCYTAAHIWIDLTIMAQGLSELEKQQFANVPGCWKQTQSNETVL